MFDPSDRLSIQEKEAIRDYILKLVALPGIFLTILSFVLGFGLNEIARGSAYSDAYTEAFAEVTDTSVDLLNQIKESQVRADDAREKADKAHQLVNQNEKESTSIIRNLENKNNEADLLLENMESINSAPEKILSVDEIANKLAQDNEFVSSITSQFSSDLKELTDRSQNLADKIQEIETDLGSRVKFGQSLQIRSGGLYLNLGGSRAEKQVTLTSSPNRGWMISK